MNLFVQAWRGEASLAKAFWIVFVVVGTVLNLICSLIVRGLLDSSPATLKAAIIILSIIIFLYTLFSAICVWRCGKNSTSFWSILSKAVVAIAVVFNLVALIINFRTPT